MTDNSDIQVLRDGIVTDFRVETLMGLAVANDWGQPDTGQLFMEVVQEFLQSEFDTAPDFKALIDPHTSFQCDAFDGYVTTMLVDDLGLDLIAASSNSPSWPGEFPYMRNARIAVSLYNKLSGTWTAFVPGESLCHATYLAVLQLCREVSEEAYNQPEFNLPPWRMN